MGVSRYPRNAAGVYGNRLAENLGAKDAPVVVTRSLGRSEMAVTKVRVDQPLQRLHDPLPCVDAYIISLILQDISRISYWEGSRHVGENTLMRGHTAFTNLKNEPHVSFEEPLHALLFYLPRVAIDALADEASVPAIDEFQFEPGVGVFDETIMRLGLSFLPALDTPDRVNKLFTDYIALALATHAAQTYGGMQTLSRPLKGGLAPWQEKLSKEMIASDLSGGITLHEIAKACGLSVSHFSRAFRKSTGVAPHAWLLQIRVDMAKAMLRKRGDSLSAIASACGFADQSHFTRIFTRRVGLNPGTWRRTMVD